MRRAVLLTFVLLSTAGCVTPGSYLRVATASQADLTAAAEKDFVWYEFQPGDVVPFHFLFFGAIEGAADAAPLKAKRQFYLVMRKGLPVMVSFDGKTYATSHAMKTIITVLPGTGPTGGQVGWFHFLGDSPNPEQELEALMKDNRPR